LNHFADSSYYFIRVENTEAKTIEKKSFSGSTSYTTNECEIVRFHEVERRTEISDYVKSGRNWYGEEFSFDTEQEFGFSSPLNITNVRVKARTAHRSAVPSQFQVRINNSNAGSISLPNVSVQIYSAAYVRHGTSIFERSINGAKNINVELEYIKNRSDAQGWLDYITLNMRVPLRYFGDQLYFTDIQSIGNDFARFNISESSGARVWDVSNPFDIYELELDGTGFTNVANDMRQYILFKPGDAKRPIAQGLVKNQNLHSIEVPDMLIVAHPSLFSEAMEIAEIHEQHDGINSFITTPGKIYNEYSSGKQDIAAIRNFVRHLYVKNPDKFKYLLFVGDASYDYKNRLSNNSNLVPTFQTVSSHDPIYSWASDDFFGFLDENEGMPNVLYSISKEMSKKLCQNPSPMILTFQLVE